LPLPPVTSETSSTPTIPVSASRRVLILSSDILPYPGLPTVGSGLRAWSLGQALMERGHSVSYSMPRAALRGREHLISDEVRRSTWVPYAIHEAVDRVRPDCVVVCNWPLLDLMDADKVTATIVLDQHGPHLLEREFQRFGDPADNARRKINALRKADYFTCCGHHQSEYFQQWLQNAGWSDEERASRTGVIPLSLSPTRPEREPSQELTFVYGGVFLPWQDPSLSLAVLLEEMERRNQGRLLFFGGRHAVYPVDPGIYESLAAQLSQSSHVTMAGFVSRDVLIDAYRRAHVAIDLMRRNCERELAFTTRTVEYLWCGLPVIYNNYSELSEYIRAYNAGWTVDPDDSDAIRAVLADIFTHPEVIAERSVNAQRLMREQLSWDKTIGPLDGFVRRQDRRPNATRTGNSGPGHLWHSAMLRWRSGGLRAVVRELVPYLRWRLGRLRRR
jgi:glycosyltransferase involved in cell wall biosynthesis